MLFHDEARLLAPAGAADAAAPDGFALERPPPGLARGRYAASAWSIVTLGAALVLITVAYFFLRLRKPRS
jgi:hypothetical protein